MRGSTPSFMPLIRNGLEQHTDYTLGGWGGRPEYKNGNHMQDGNDLKNGVPDSHYTFQRWLPAIQNDWAARADWCVADEYSKANHQPVARILGESVRTVRPGEKIYWMPLLHLTLIKIHCLTNGGNIGKQAVCKQRWL